MIRIKPKMIWKEIGKRQVRSERWDGAYEQPKSIPNCVNYCGG